MLLKKIENIERIEEEKNMKSKKRVTRNGSGTSLKYP